MELGSQMFIIAPSIFFHIRIKQAENNRLEKIKSILKGREYSQPNLLPLNIMETKQDTHNAAKQNKLPRGTYLLAGKNYIK